MTQGPSLEPALQKLVTMIRERTGNVIPQSRYPFLEELAQRRAQGKGFNSVAGYVTALENDLVRAEWESLIPLLTIKESYFFRAPQQFEIIRKEILPQILAAHGPSRQIRIWSAACARGEEPATLAILLTEEKALDGWSWSIVATDVDEEALAGARLGLYGDRAVAQVPPELLERYFNRRGKLFELSAELRARIFYRSLNLAHPPFELPFAEYDLILLRNVLIYFRRPLQRRVVSQVGQSLSRDGYLFLGASETLWQIQDELESVDLGSCFAYRHRREPKEAAPPAPRQARRPADPPPVVRATPPRRIEPERLSAPPPPPAVPPPSSIHERLLDAARSLSANRIAEASQVIGAVLAEAPAEPSAHALEGFLHDLTGRTDEAVASYRAALYLDPALFQVRIFLADCLLRLGNRDRAEHHYREVLAHLAAGRERSLPDVADLPFPDRARAQRRCRQVLGG
ncbi:MAG TPA: CheR family methyltransferase [Thermoanaerobaculia bacterium]|nr:CheR family methyltransferase [Thermoanaerobaculia bacterium]